MKTVLIAGGAGFIGSHLCGELLAKGYEVFCLDNLLTGDKKNVEEFSHASKFHFMQHDITTPIPQLNVEINSIFHLASPASPNKKSPRSYMSYPIETLLANSHGTHNLLEFAKAQHARFVYASTSEIYGDPAISPQPETYFGNVNILGPRAVYDESKRFGEALTIAYVRKFNTDCRIARIFNTYGPKMQIDDGRVVSNFINQALRHEELTVYGDGTQTRSFCYISDLVDGLSSLMFTENLKGEVINLGNPIEKNMLEFATLIQKMIGSNSQIVFEDLPEDDPKQRRPDITKAKKLLQWEPKISLEDGLRRTIDYFKTTLSI